MDRLSFVRSAAIFAGILSLIAAVDSEAHSRKKTRSYKSTSQRHGVPGYIRDLMRDADSSSVFVDDDGRAYWMDRAGKIHSGSARNTPMGDLSQGIGSSSPSFPDYSFPGEVFESEPRKKSKQRKPDAPRDPIASEPLITKKLPKETAPPLDHTQRQRPSENPPRDARPAKPRKSVPSDLGKCKSHVLSEMKRHDPNGYSVYQRAPKAFFEDVWWGQCKQHKLLNYGTAVHETVHLLTEEKGGAFPLIGGGYASGCRDKGMMHPKECRHEFHANNEFVKTYLTAGKASSAVEFCYLLNELNAYTHDLNAVVKLKHLTNPNMDVGHRDGLLALMAFVKSYLQRAKNGHPASWAKINAEPMKSTIRTLWRQAESVLTSSCQIPKFSTNDSQYYFGKMCNGNSDALATVVGAGPSCPSNCNGRATRPLAEVSSSSVTR